MSETRKRRSQATPAGADRHESLPPELLEQIGALFGVLGPYLGMSLEQLRGRLHAGHASGERGRPLVQYQRRRGWPTTRSSWPARHCLTVRSGSCWGALIVISTGVEDVSKLGVPVEVGRRLLRCYGDLGKTEEGRDE